MLHPRDLRVEHLDGLARLVEVLVDAFRRRLLAHQTLRGGIAHVLDVPDLGLEVLDLGPEHRDLDPLGVGRVIEGGDDAPGVGDLGVLGGQRVRGRLERGDLFEALLLGLGDLAAERLDAGGELVGDRGLFQELAPEQVDRLVLAGDLAQLRGDLGLELVDAHLEPPRVERELGPQVVLVGLDFGHRHRDGVFETALGEADGALVDEGNQDDRQQTRDEKATPEIHDRFDHGRHSCLPPRFMAESRFLSPRDARMDASATRHTPSPGTGLRPASRVRRPRSERVPGQNGFQVDCGVNFK